VASTGAHDAGEVRVTGAAARAAIERCGQCLDYEGHSAWAFRQTEGINDEEIIGALTVQLELWKAKTLEDYGASGSGLTAAAGPC
jgi:hypothetical protein